MRDTVEGEEQQGTAAALVCGESIEHRNMICEACMA